MLDLMLLWFLVNCWTKMILNWVMMQLKVHTSAW
uniref:Uncharacterized protein n=1 Tax=Rhizophora mucronata TaxID=61149 RepID=A0A2P2QZ82_RHIMU